MRVIKFRAKCLDNGEWVCGGSSLISDDFCVIQKGTEFYCETRVYSRTERFFQLQGFVCDKNTLGQFTGLLDKNGKEIYEGDIIRTKRYGVVHGQSNTQGADLFRVVYKNAQFYIDNKLRHFYLQDSKCNEVIGNIHDNPELLKGGIK